MAKRGWLYRSKDGTTAFEEGLNPFPQVKERTQGENGAGCRYVAVDVTDSRLKVYFSNIGDTPERILRSSVKLKPDWRDWRAGPVELVLKPETEYEGAGLPLNG